MRVVTEPMSMLDRPGAGTPGKPATDKALLASIRVYEKC
jgi:hypothetical protein